jgi:peptidoglycan/LPS O-acetylase OafA/YrhL
MDTELKRGGVSATSPSLVAEQKAARAPKTRVWRILAPYQRITSSGQFIPEIDGLRFIAIFSVFVYHLAGDILRHSPPQYGHSLQAHPLFNLTQQLSIGVPLFFIISGFILGLPFATRLEKGQSLSLKKYFLRRLTRLEPPYALSMLLLFVLKIVGGRGSFTHLLPYLGASVAYIHNLVYGEPSIISVVAWSLEIEVQFYILAPLLSLVFLLNPVVRGALLIAGCAGFSAVSVAFAYNPFVHLSLLGNAQYFLAGFLLVDLYQLGRGKSRMPTWVWDMICAVGWGGVFIGLVVNATFTLAIIPFLVPVLYFATFEAGVVNRLLTNLWITTIGGMCYTIYLLHNYAIALLGFRTESIGAGLPFEVRLLIQMVLISPGVVVVSAFYFRFVERPCMYPDWPRQLANWLKRRDDPVVAANPQSKDVQPDLLQVGARASDPEHPNGT